MENKFFNIDYREMEKKLFSLALFDFKKEMKKYKWDGKIPRKYFDYLNELYSKELIDEIYKQLIDK
jgi:hypothetical protein